jgi:hypothetical protein
MLEKSLRHAGTVAPYSFAHRRSCPGKALRVRVERQRGKAAEDGMVSACLLGAVRG